MRTFVATCAVVTALSLATFLFDIANGVLTFEATLSIRAMDAATSAIALVWAVALLARKRS